MYVDADVAFYGPVQEIVERVLQDHMLAFQYDGECQRHPVACTGVFAFRAGYTTAKYFTDATALISEMKDDQSAINALLQNERIRWHVLDRNMFWTQGAASGRRWVPGDPVTPPAELLVHHANWTVGIGNKVLLLEEVAHVIRRIPTA